MTDLPSRLYTWANNEMKFSPTPDCKYTLNPNDLKDICEGENANIWKYCIQHIASLKTVQNVKGNLKIKNIQNKLNKQDNENISIDSINEQVIEEKQRDLAQNLLISESNIQYLQKSVSQKEEKIYKIEENVNELTAKWKELHHKYILLDKYCKHIDNKIRSYQKLDDELCKKISSMRNKARSNYSTIESAKQEFSEKEDNVTVKSTVDFIENYLINSVRTESDNESTKHSSFQKLSDDIKYHIQNKIASQIVTNLTNQCRENILFISKFNDENLEILSSKEDYKEDESSIQELLEGERLIHIKKYLESEKLNIDCLKLEEQFSALEVVMESELRKHNLERPIDIELIKEVLKQEAELVGCTKSLEVLKNSVSELEKDSQYLEKKKENLITKFEKIQNFHKIVEKEKNIICSLLKQNLQMSVKIFSQQKEMCEFSESSLFKYNSDIDKLCQQLQNWILEEVYHFNNIQLSFLSSHLHRNLPRLWENTEMTQIANLFDLKLHQAPERLLFSSANILMLNISYKELVKSVQEMMTAINERVTMCKDEDMKEISIKDEQGAIQCSNLHKKVQKYLEYIDKGIKRNEEIKEMIHVWWNQPAQFISVSVKIDDRLLCHWLRLWSFTMHKLNKKK